MKELCILSAILALAGALPAVAAERCSIHPAKAMSGAQLNALAKVSQAQAERIALDRLGNGSVSIASAELESEHGCLIWSFDLRIAGKTGIQEVQVDAGDGKILSVKRESSRKEAAEAAKETVVLQINSSRE